MRPILRLVAPMLLAIGIVTCSDTPIAAVKQGTTPAHLGVGKLAFNPVFSKAASAIASQLQSLGLPFNNVRVVIHGMPDTTTIVLDTIVDYSQSATSDLVLNLTVKVEAEDQRFNVGLDYRNGDKPLYHGAAVVQSYQPGKSAPPQVDVPIEFVGPGATAKSVTIANKSVTLSGTQSATLTATAKDASGNVIPDAVIAWSSSNPGVANVGQTTGIVQALGVRGSATITASTLTGVSDDASVNVVLPPASIAVVGGAGQSGKVHTALAAPAVVQVSAADGVGVGGVSVVFSAPTGGAVGSTSVTTDASGRASTSLTLGTVAGPQSFAATAAGFSTGITETATAGDPATIAIASGSGQTDTVRKALAPIIAKVTDQFTNPVPNVAVSWSASGGTVGSASTTTGVDGTTSNSYTLGSTPGPASASASITGAGSVTFNFTALPAAPAAIAVVSGQGQVGRAGTSLPVPFVVKVTDAAGNPTPNVAVSWSATNGTIDGSSLTSSDGTASNTMTLGTKVGQAAATVSVAGHAVTFSATVQPGFVAQAVFTTQPANGTAGVTMAPVSVALFDQYGNATSAVNAVTIALGANASGATLSGTLTRNAVSGVATFDDLKLDKAGSYTLKATSGNTPGATSTAFSMTSSGAAVMQILDPTTLQPIPATQAITVSATAGVAPTTSPLIKITDLGGQPVANASVSVSAVGTSPSHTISGTLTTNAQGLVALAGMIEIADVYTVTATASGLTGSPRTATVNVSAAAASKLAFSVQPTNATSGAAISPAVVVAVEDQYGNIVPGDTRQIGVALTPNTGSANATLSGTSTKSAANGIATFSDLSIATAGTGYTLSATSGTLAPAKSGAFNVTSSTPTMQVLDATSLQPITGTISLSATAGTTPTNVPLVKVTDGSGQPAANVLVAISAVGVSSGQSVNTTITTNSQGTAAFLPVPITVADSFTVTATVAGVSGSPRTATLKVSPATAGKVVFVTQPSSVVTNAHISPAVVIAVEDQYGNIVTGDTRQVNLAITPASGAHGAVLSGTSTVSTGVVQQTASGGKATFSDLSVATAGAGYTLTATSSPTLTSAVSTTFNVTAASATQLLVVPATSTAFTMVAGSTPTNAPVLRTTDASGNGVASVPVRFLISTIVNGSSVTVKDTALTSDATGTIALNGTDFKVTQVGVYTITATSTAIPNASVTLTVGVTPAPATQLVFLSPTSSSSATAAGSPIPFSVALEDQYGNVATTSSATVSIGSLHPPSGVTGASLSGTASTQTISGIAVFTTLSINKAAIGYTVTASASGLSSATSAAFNIIAGSIKKYTITALNASPLISGTTTVTATATDAYDNAVSTATAHTVNWSMSSGSGSVSPTSSTTNTVGQATTTYTAPSSTGTAEVVKAVDASDPTISGTVTLTPQAGGATQLVVTSGPTTGRNRIGLDAFTVQLKDANNAAVSLQGVQITPTITSAPGGGTTYGGFSSASTGSDGSVTFRGLSVKGPVGNYTINFTAPGFTPASTTVAVAAGNPHQIVHLVTLPSVVTPGHKLSTKPRIRVLDDDGNVVTNSAVNFTISSGGGSLSVASVTTDGTGEADGPTWTVGSAGTNTLHAASAVSTASSDLSVTAATPDHIALSASNLSTVQNGNTLPSIDATVVDAAGDAIQDTVYAVEANGHTHSDRSISVHGSGSTSSSGKVTFSNLQVDAQQQSGATLDFDVVGQTSLTGSATFNVAVGAAAVLQNLSASSLQLGITEGLAGIDTVVVKDHNGRNGVSIPGVSISWSLSSGCVGVSFSGTPTSLTDSTGQAAAPALIVTDLSWTSCTLTASGSNLQSTSVTLQPLSSQQSAAHSVAARASMTWFNSAVTAMARPQAFEQAEALADPLLALAVRGVLRS